MLDAVSIPLGYSGEAANCLKNGGISGFLQLEEVLLVTNENGGTYDWQRRTPAHADSSSSQPELQARMFAYWLLLS
jgi:hypothetical protein